MLMTHGSYRPGDSTLLEVVGGVDRTAFAGKTGSDLPLQMAKFAKRMVALPPLWLERRPLHGKLLALSGRPVATPIPGLRSAVRREVNALARADRLPAGGLGESLVPSEPLPAGIRFATRTFLAYHESPIEFSARLRKPPQIATFKCARSCLDRATVRHLVYGCGTCRFLPAF